MGEAIKVRGGARSMKFLTTTLEDEFYVRASTNMDIKEKIAFSAAQLIEPGRSVFIDSGSTMHKMTRFIPDERLTVVTTAPNIAMELVKKSKLFVNIVGGMLNKYTYSVSGSQAVHFLEDINIDLALVVASGFSLDAGFSCGNYSECEIKKFVVNKARKTVLIIDSTKTGKNLPYTFATFEDIDILVADEGVSRDIIEAAKAKGVEVIIS
jgi:DeoR/GlpR family transcriptional regulator of sugar metabolism